MKKDNVMISDLNIYKIYSDYKCNLSSNIMHFNLQAMFIAGCKAVKDIKRDMAVHSNSYKSKL